MTRVAAAPRAADARWIASLGAFPFPYPQGSQIFFADQARALARAGAHPVLFTYGRGRGEPPADLEQVRAPGWAAPRAMRSGPNAGKPLADAALLAAWLRESRRRRFVCALAHNAEAAGVALAARAVTRVPVVYVAHTLLRHELSAYAGAGWRPALDRLGARLDDGLAARADAVIALGDEAAATLGARARGPVAVIPPGHDPRPAPGDAAIEAACAAHDLRRGGFFLYSGNLDGYQEIDLLAAAAARLPAGAPPVVVATHDAAAARRGAAGLRVVAVPDFDAMRTLLHAATALLLTRRRIGGFPVKLLNYMEAARPIVAFASVAVGLVDGVSARLLDDAAGPEALADAMAALWRDPATGDRLGAAAHAHLVTTHGWSAIARRTLDVVDAVARAGD